MLLPFLIWNCKGFDERTKFDVTYVNRVTFDSTNTSVADGTVLSDTLIMNFKDDLSDHDSRESQVEYVRMLVFSLEVYKVKSPEDTNMNFLEKIEFYQIGQNEDLLVATTDKIPQDKGYFEMSIKFDIDKDMLSLLNNDTSTYRVVYTPKSKLLKPVVIKIGALYEVDTRKFGI